MLSKEVLSAEMLKVFESVPDSYLILSPELYILTASDAFLAATDTDRSQIKGRYIFDLFPDNPAAPKANQLSSLHASFTKVVATKKPHQMPVQRYDVPLSSASGNFKEKYWELINTPVLNEQGEILYIIHKLNDVTDHLKTQNQIQKFPDREQEAHLHIGTEQKKLEAIFMQAPVGVAIFEREDHIIKLVNPPMSRLIGRPAEELLGKPVFDAVPEARGQGFEGILEEVFSSGKPFEATEIPATVHKDGKPVEGFYNLVYHPLRNAEGKVTGIIQISIDVTEQVQSRRKVEDRERQLRLITDSLPVLIAYLDKEEKYRFANKAYEGWFPLKTEEMLGRPVKEIAGEEAYKEVKQYIDRALAGEGLEFNAEMPYRNGFTKYIHTNYVPDLQDGEVAGFYTLVTDVTEQALARQQLEESEEKYRSLFETMDQGFCILEMIFDAEDNPIDYRFIETNPVFEQQTGLKNARGKTALELVPDLENHWVEIYGKVALSGEPYHFVEGSEAMGRWFDVHAFRLGDSNSRKVALLFSDITQQKQVEESLKRSNSWFKLVNQATQDAIWDWDIENGQITWNEGIQSMFHYKPEEVLKELSWWNENIHPEDRQRVVKSIHKAIDSGEEHWSAEYRFLTGDGGYKIVFDRGSVIHSEEGKPIRMIGSMQDITERKRAEDHLKIKNEQLTRINNDLDNFIYTASHDLKAPILNIEGLVSLLSNSFMPETKNSQKVKAIMGMIHTSIAKFKETIKDLAEVAKVQSYAEEEVEDIPFESILEEVKMNIQSLIDESNATILADFSLVPTINYSKKNLRSIMYNLVSNAIKYRSKQRPVQVTITTSMPDDQYVLLSVQDNGNGIKDKDKSKVFMMFKRLNQHVEGTGIGMAIVKKIIDNSGGKIELESTVGEGSLFKIYFKTSL